jgi:hypothetical protein
MELHCQDNPMDIAKIRAALETKRTEMEETLKVIVAVLAALEGSKTVKRRRSPGTGRLSPAARQRIVDAQKARWAAYRKKKRR